MINKLYKKGNKIKIFTSRYMGRSSENIKHVNKYKSVITKQLKKWNIAKLKEAKKMLFNTELQIKKNADLDNNVLVKNLIINLYKKAEATF